MPEDVPPVPEQTDQPQKFPSPPEQTAPQRLALQPQESPFTHPDSRHHFRAGPQRPFVATPGAIEQFGLETILACLYRLQYLAQVHDGLDHLQVFEDPVSREELWIAEDEVAGTITALLPAEY